MAVSKLNNWTSALNTTPNGVMTIGAGTERLAILAIVYEATAGQTSFNASIGTISPTGNDEYYEATDNQGINVYYWNNAAIEDFVDNDIDGAWSPSAPGIQTWSFIVFEGVNQTSPISFVNSTSAEANSVDISTTSTANDWDVLLVSRSSGNRNIDGYTNLTSGWQYNTGYTAAGSDSDGGSTPLTVDIDTITDDFTYTHMIISESSGSTILPAAMYHYKNHGTI